jgi:hypothetical protein
MPRCGPFKLIDVMIMTAASALCKAQVRDLRFTLQMFGMVTLRPDSKASG